MYMRYGYDFFFVFFSPRVIYNNIIYIGNRQCECILNCTRFVRFVAASQCVYNIYMHLVHCNICAAAMSSDINFHNVVIRCSNVGRWNLAYFIVPLAKENFTFYMCKCYMNVMRLLYSLVILLQYKRL